MRAVVAKLRDHAIGRIPIVDRRGQDLLRIDDMFGWMRDQLQAVIKRLECQGQGPRLHPPTR